MQKIADTLPEPVSLYQSTKSPAECYRPKYDNKLGLRIFQTLP
jgi:hypothetical protein